MKGILRVDLQGPLSGNNHVHIQDHCQIRRHHKAVVITGRQLYNHCVIKNSLTAYLKFIPPQGDAGALSVLPGNVFRPHRLISASRGQSDGILRDFQRECLVRILKRHCHVTQGKVGVVVIGVIQGLYRTCGSGIRLYQAGPGDLKRRVCTDRQVRADQDYSQRKGTYSLQDFFHWFSLLIA